MNENFALEKKDMSDLATKHLSDLCNSCKTTCGLYHYLASLVWKIKKDNPHELLNSFLESLLFVISNKIDDFIPPNEQKEFKNWFLK